MKNGIKKIRDLAGWCLIIIVGAIAANIGKEFGTQHMGPAMVAAMRSTPVVTLAPAPAPAPPISPATINQTEAHRADEVAIAHAREEAQRDAERCTAARAAAREAPILAEKKRQGVPRDILAEATAIEPAPVDPDVARAERTASRTCLRAEQSQREADALTEPDRLTDAPPPPAAIVRTSTAEKHEPAWLISSQLLGDDWLCQYTVAVYRNGEVIRNDNFTRSYASAAHEKCPPMLVWGGTP